MLRNITQSERGCVVSDKSQKSSTYFLNGPFEEFLDCVSQKLNKLNIVVIVDRTERKWLEKNVLGLVHNWCYVIFEQFLPPTPIVTLFKTKAMVLLSQSPWSLPFKTVNLFMNDPRLNSRHTVVYYFYLKVQLNKHLNNLKFKTTKIKSNAFLITLKK